MPEQQSEVEFLREKLRTTQEENQRLMNLLKLFRDQIDEAIRSPQKSQEVTSGS